MPKAKTIDRLEYSKQRCPNLKKYTKENSPFLMMVAEMKQEHPELHNDFTCPSCGGELVRSESCYRCKKCGWSRC